MTTSVALCTFNGETFLEKQLDSILSQKLAVNEIVVCEDASTDSTMLILEKYKKNHGDLFRIYTNAETLGFVCNFEKALSLCSGDIIFLCDQDDVWYSEKVQEIARFFAENKEIDVVAHNLELLGSDVSAGTFWDLKNFSTAQKQLPADELLKYILINGNVFPGMSLALRREILKEYLPLKKIDSILIHDYEIVVKAIRDHKFAIIDKILGQYRQHDTQSIGYKEKPLVLANKLTEIQLQSQTYLRLKKYTSVFGLNTYITTSYRRECQRRYSSFLKQFPIGRRLFYHLKNKYYYQIIHF